MAEYLTAQLPGTGGTLRNEPDDFVVEEIPLYEPCGTGEHLYIEVEKRGLTTYDLLRELAAALGRSERDLGYAGLKDARAVTRQTVSIPQCAPHDVEGIDIPGVRILSARCHRNKLRPGHLAGNRFRIRIHRPVPESLSRARIILDTLEDLGVPNRYGEQRYGLLASNHKVGRAILQQDFDTAVNTIIGDPELITHPAWQSAARLFRAGDLAEAVRAFPRHCRNERRLLETLLSGKPARRAVMNLPRNVLRLYLSAYQSSLFDRMVDMRLATLERLWPGDLAYKHDNGACFPVTDPAAEQARADRFEISPTAPLFGYKVRLAEGQAGLLERSLLDKEKLESGAFRLSGGLAMAGERRPVRVPLTDVSLAADNGDLVLGFVLPKGSFATTVLAEVMKTETEDPTGELH